VSLGEVTLISKRGPKELGDRNIARERQNAQWQTGGSQARSKGEIEKRRTRHASGTVP